MTPEELNSWRRLILERLDVLKTKAIQARRYMEARDLRELEDKADIRAAWDKVRELFPEGFVATRAGDLARHLGFAMQHDFSDIENLDIPALVGAVQHYGRRGEEHIRHEIEGLKINIDTWELLHPQVRDACKTQFDNGLHKEAARAAVELLMDELRQLTGRRDDGDQLIREVIGPNAGQVGFSECVDASQKSITEGLKQMLQGLYKGVRNPTSHGFDGFTRLETLQIMVLSSFLLGRLQFVPGPAKEVEF